MNVIINIQICTYKWGNSIDLGGGAPVSMLNFYNSYYATRNLVDNPINKNTKESKTKQRKVHHKWKIQNYLASCFRSMFQSLFRSSSKNYVSRCVHVFTHCIGCSKSFSLSSLNLFIKVICKVTLSFSGIHKVRKFY